MALRDPAVEEYASELVKAGILTNAEKNRMEFDERYTEARYRLQDVREKVPETRLRSSDWKAFESISEDAGMDKPVRVTSAVQHLSGSAAPAPEGLSGWIHQAIGSPLAAVGWAYGQLSKLDGEDYLEGGGQTRKDIQRALEEAGINVPIDALTRPNSLDELLESLSEDYDVPPEALEKVVTEANDAAIQRAVDEARTEERIEENEEIDRTNEENPTYAKNLAAFQILDSAHPTKYKFDQQTGAIYMTETGAQVDRRGNELAFDDGTAGAELVGGWPEGVAPIFEPDPAGTGWGAMSLEAGIPVTEADYMDVLDVINNKEWYGADPSRYISGQAFLGGFDDSYRVKVEENDVMRRTRSTRDALGGDTATRQFLGGHVWDAMDDALQDTRRPWYDPNDNWAQFAGLSPENVAAVQSRMISVGALDPDEVVTGVWGPTEALQMKKWMTIANGQAVQWTELDEEMLTEYFGDEAAATRPRAAFTPDPYRPMDPATVELTVRDSVRALIGRDPTEEDLQQLGGYLTDQYSSSYQADVTAAKQQYSAQSAALEAEAQFGDPGTGPADVDFESRYILEMEKRFQPQIESQERGELAARQQDMGQSMSNLMNRLGGGLG